MNALTLCTDIALRPVTTDDSRQDPIQIEVRGLYRGVEVVEVGGPFERVLWREPAAFNRDQFIYPIAHWELEEIINPRMRMPTERHQWMGWEEDRA